ncbi:MAG: class III poly(R)-hydroxyalkanoic acid synthase subunit PhaC [Candidatus Thermoplasmatota archaeon]
MSTTAPQQVAGAPDVLDWSIKWTTAMAESASRTAKALETYAHPPDVYVGETPADVAWSENKLRLLHYRPLAPRKTRTPLLIVYALVNRPSILDLQSDRSVVRRFLEAGHDVYLIDWGTPTRLDRNLTLDDYVNRYIHGAVRAIKRESGATKVSILGYCMGGAMSAMYAAIHPEEVQALALMAAPLDFTDDSGLLTAWARPEHFNVDALVDALGNIPPDFLAGGFQYLKPYENTMGKLMGLQRIADDQGALENFFRMEKWSNDGIPVPGETYRQYIKDLYQHNRLARGEMEIGGTRLSLAHFTMPILAITGDHDHLVPSGTTVGFVEKLPTKSKSFLRCSTGHVGLSVSSRAHKEVWPKAAQWFTEHGESPA